MTGRLVEFTYHSTVPWSLFLDNIDASLKRDLPRLLDVVPMGSATEPAAIVGGGPSLKSQIEKLKKFEGVIYGAGTVHDYLIENGIVPTYHVVMDPDVETFEFIKKPHPEVTYLLASQCHQKTFDALKGYKILLWHSFNTVNDEGKPIHDFNYERAIGGGDSVVLRAFPIAILLGHKKFSFFGFDCSFPLDCEDQHVYDYQHYREEPVSVEVDGRKYYTTPGLMIQLRSFITYITLSEGLEVSVNGDNLVAALCYRDLLCQT